MAKMICKKSYPVGGLRNEKGEVVYYLHAGKEYDVEKHKAFTPVMLEGEEKPRRYTHDVWVADNRVVLGYDRVEEHFKM